ncbi:MAG: Fe-S metabolism associated SufE [Verrucomicrobiales bacterium]|nr:Fe-S metabolism associated SufE [Verrucomicrobiales bacterium]
MYPAPLQALIDLFAGLPETDRRETLINLAESAPLHAPQEGEIFDLEDVRKDEECTDTVGIHLHSHADGTVSFRVSLGPQVQTLTRAMTSILCQGFEGVKPQEILEVPADFVPKIVGAELVRLRSQTVYYVLTRMKSAVKVLLNRQRAAALEGT